MVGSQACWRIKVSAQTRLAQGKCGRQRDGQGEFGQPVFTAGDCDCRLPGRPTLAADSTVVDSTLPAGTYSSSSSSRSSSPSSPRCRLVPPADAAFPFPFPLPDYADDDDALSAGRAGPGQFFWPLRQPDRWQTLSGREAVRFCQGAGGRHNVTDDLPAKLLVLLVLASSASASASACPSACPSRRRPGAACRSRAGRAACWP